MEQNKNNLCSQETNEETPVHKNAINLTLQEKKDPTLLSFLTDVLCPHLTTSSRTTSYFPSTTCTTLTPCTHLIIKITSPRTELSNKI